jgi:hypothetical protein
VFGLQIANSLEKVETIGLQKQIVGGNNENIISFYWVN